MPIRINRLDDLFLDKNGGRIEMVRGRYLPPLPAFSARREKHFYYPLDTSNRVFAKGLIFNEFKSIGVDPMFAIFHEGKIAENLSYLYDKIVGGEQPGEMLDLLKGIMQVATQSMPVVTANNVFHMTNFMIVTGMSYEYFSNVKRYMFNLPEYPIFHEDETQNALINSIMTQRYMVSLAEDGDDESFFSNGTLIFDDMKDSIKYRRHLTDNKISEKYGPLASVEITFEYAKNLAQRDIDTLTQRAETENGWNQELYDKEKNAIMKRYEDKIAKLEKEREDILNTEVYKTKQRYEELSANRTYNCLGLKGCSSSSPCAYREIIYDRIYRVTERGIVITSNGAGNPKSIEITHDHLLVYVLSNFALYALPEGGEDGEYHVRNRLTGEAVGGSEPDKGRTIMLISQDIQAAVVQNARSKRNRAALYFFKKDLVDLYTDIFDTAEKGLTVEQFYEYKAVHPSFTPDNMGYGPLVYPPVEPLPAVETCLHELIRGYHLDVLPDRLRFILDIKRTTRYMQSLAQENMYGVSGLITNEHVHEAELYFNSMDFSQYNYTKYIKRDTTDMISKQGELGEFDNLKDMTMFPSDEELEISAEPTSSRSFIPTSIPTSSSPFQGKPAESAFIPPSTTIPFASGGFFSDSRPVTQEDLNRVNDALRPTRRTNLALSPYSSLDSDDSEEDEVDDMSYADIEAQARR